MRLIRDLSSIPVKYRSAVIAVGNFDGLHLGHQAVIGEAIKHAKKLKTRSAVLTFEPHPREYFSKDAAPFHIYRLRTKLSLLRKTGIDAVFLQRFNASFAALSAESFCDEVLSTALDATHIVTGEDFVFGAKRSGNAERLSQAAKRYDFGYTSVSTVKDNTGNACSSTRIRTLLAEGNMEAAAAFLGRPYHIEGRVQHGDARGRTLGFPTANLALNHIFTPAFGAYAARAILPDGAILHAVANLGIRPSFGENAPLLEVHLFNYSRDLYGMRLKVQLIRHLRPEYKFEGIDALKAQIEQDCIQAKDVLHKA